ncbi:hypothetical protein HDU79_005243 [Rhizoclosmatium sp. JEL0117]|nr:hypothetical protein HDU79_005243 [Rhizoclosmatium sp. JEL0117]
MNRPFQVAIDGVASTGKSQTAKRLARLLPGFVHVDSGAMYRAVALKALNLNLDPSANTGKADIAAVASHIDLRFEAAPPGSDAPQTVLLDGVDVTADIRSREVARSVSAVAAIGDVRKVLVTMQQKLANTPGANGVVMEGRDIGAEVLPTAELKIFLDGSVDIRAKRRLNEMKASAEKEGKPFTATLSELIEDVKARDHADYTRQISPLRKADGAVVIDTSFLSMDDQVDLVLDLVKQRLKK